MYNGNINIWRLLNCEDYSVHRCLTGKT